VRERECPFVLRKEKRKCYWPLSFIDGVNGVCVSSEKEFDRALERAAGEAGIRCKSEKRWK